MQRCPAAATGWKERWKMQKQDVREILEVILPGRRMTEKEILEIVKRKSRQN
ncbi:MAG: hypothetical protein N2V71_02305 [Methanophagales archaeon]|nr:hypothetical protein [Methanophagales archaeon]MCW3137856.1 hypothetical protein [Methanophagales archaeon]MCW3139440.1 hypothetical protein [Methanophagales archaeon]MCW7069819.1 hypothetical protein [Methanophagales archaeon]